MVSKARDDLPDPERPVKTISRSRGRSRETSRRLCSRAPRTTRRSTICRGYREGVSLPIGPLLGLVEEQPRRVGPGVAQSVPRLRAPGLALYAGAAPGIVEGLGGRVLGQNPQEERRGRVTCDEGARRLRHQPGADPMPLLGVGDVEVVEERPPGRIFPEDG